MMKINEVDITVEVGDATLCPADVLVLKYAQDHYGLDAVVADRLSQAGAPFTHLRPKVGGFRLLSSEGSIAASKVLFIGVDPLRQFGYQKIRQFARKALTALAGAEPAIEHICLTIHGPGYGLDEVEAFESEIAGLVDAITCHDYPESLSRITFSERNPGRATRLKEALKALTATPRAETASFSDGTAEELPDRLRSVGYDSASKPNVFVAMPFKQEFLDTYHYGIYKVVKELGFLCERADLAIFTGDILSWIHGRIHLARLVIAEVTEANPNVYLELGYAWGRGIPTLLLTRDKSTLMFDIQGHRFREYQLIQDLEKHLREELPMLLAPLPTP